MHWRAAGQGDGLTFRRFGRPFSLQRFLLALLFVALVPATNFTTSLLVFGPTKYVRKTGPPVTVINTFQVKHASNPYLLKVVNHGVTSAVVTLNGQVVLGPHDFPDKDKDGILTRSVSLKAGTNKISVELRSKPGTWLTISIMGSAENQRPTADAGADQELTVGTLAQLDGSKSRDPDGDPLHFNWTLSSRPAGSQATLSDPHAVKPTFVVDRPGTYIACLVVDDGDKPSEPDTVIIKTKNAVPVADAGPDQTVAIKQLVQLNGSGSTDLDGDPLKYSWTLISRPNGSAASLSNPSIVAPTFVADLPGNYIASLKVSDGKAWSAPDTVTVSTRNSAPVAHAGPDQTAVVGSVVTLDGSQSTDIDGDPLQFAWSFVSFPGSNAPALSDAAAVRPTFPIELPGSYVLQLVVHDGKDPSSPDTVTISTQNSPPVAHAGPDQRIRVGNVVALDGSGSTDVDGDALTYSWSLITVPNGSNAALDNTEAIRPTFRVDRPGSYVAQLIVYDGFVAGTPDTVVITTENSPPVANAGADRTVVAGQAVTLDGSGSSDVDGDVLAYQWSLASVPDGSTAQLTNVSSPQPSFVADLPGNYVAQLVVSDGVASSEPDTVTISTTNSVPVANAGPDQSGVPVGAPVTLDGTGSSDPDDHPISYSWSLIARPSGSDAVLSDTSAAQPTFTPDAVGDYVAQLIVNDAFGSSAPDTVLIQTNQPPIANAGPDQQVQLGTTVHLDGTGSSDPDGNTISYLWSFTSVPANSSAFLQSANAPMASFVADQPGSFVVELTVTDSVGATARDSVLIEVSPPPVTVTVVATDPDASETGPDSGAFAVTRSAVLSDPLTVFYAVSGSAINGVDFNQLSGSVTIPAGQASASVIVVPIDDDQIEDSELLVITLEPDTAYGIGLPDAATIGIADNDQQPANQAPAVSAGPNQTITLPDSATLAGTAADDGLPLGSLLTGSWSVVTAPETAGQSWLKTTPSGTLPPEVRQQLNLLFDPTTNRLIVFGGTTNHPSNEVWVLSGANGQEGNPSWTQLQPTGSGPGPRVSHATIYDPASNRMVVFGGIGPSYPHTNNDVWILTNANGTGGTPVWLQVTPAGPLPVPRFGVGLAYDAATNRMIMFGGSIWAASGQYYFDSNQTWVLTNANGTEPAPPTWIPIAPTGSLPVERTYSTVAYDPGSDRLIVFGGFMRFTQEGIHLNRNFNDTWVLTNANGVGGPPSWIQLTPDGASTSPTQRSGAAAAYNVTNHTLTAGLGAGSCTTTPDACTQFSDVWSLQNANGLGGPAAWTPLAPTGEPPINASSSAYDIASDRLIGLSSTSNDTWILTNATNSIAGTVTFSNPTSSIPNIAGQVLAATTNAVFNGPGSYVLRLTGSDSQLSSTSDVSITVQPPVGAPFVASVVPNTSRQGDSGLLVAITGQNTHFVQGSTQVYLGAGIAVTSVNVTSDTTLTVNISIEATAPLGARSVAVITGNETASLASGFFVLPQPLLLSITPNASVQGAEDFEVSVVGLNTHFTNSSVVDLGAGITIESASASDPMHLVARLSIATNAEFGARTLRVTSGLESVTLSSAFSVSAGAPEIVSVVSNSAQQGDTLTVAITGRFTNFKNGETTAKLGQGISVGGAPAGEDGPVFVTSPTTALATIHVDPNSVWRRVNASGSPGFLNEHASAYDRVSDRLIVYGGVIPNGARSSLYHVTNASGAGSGPTEWVSVQASGDSPGPREALSSAYDATNDRLIVFGGGAGDYEPIFNDVHVLTNASGRGGAPTWIGLHPTDPKPSPRIWSSTAYDPVSNRMIVLGGRRGGQEYFLDVWVLTNANGQGGSPQWIQLNVTNPPGPLGRQFPSIAYDPETNRLIVWTFSSIDPSRSDVWLLSNANGLGGPPAWTPFATNELNALTGLGFDSSSNTLIGLIGCESLAVMLQNADPITGVPTTARLGPFATQPPVRCNYYGSDYDAISDRFLIAGGSLPQGESLQAFEKDIWVLEPALRSAVPGTRTVRVRTTSEELFKTDAFRVVAAAGPPSFALGISQGTTGQRVTVEIRSANADFVDGASLAQWGSGIGVGAGPEGGFGPLRIIGPELALAEIAISPTATAGLRDVIIKIGGSEFSLPGRFYINQRPVGVPPTLAPVAGARGQQLDVQINDGSARLQQGVTRVYFGAGVTVNSLVVQSSTSLRANITIAPDAPIGMRNVSIVYIQGPVTPFPYIDASIVYGGFAVLPGNPQPALLSVSPSTAIQGATFQMTVNGQLTNFEQGITQLDLGPDVAVNALSVADSDTLTAQIVVSPSASSGSRKVTVTTGGEIVSLPNGFRVLAGTNQPTIALVAPNSGRQGQGGPVTIVSQNTHFAQGASHVDMGPGIVVGAITVSCDTCLEVEVSIADDAPAGSHPVTVSTGAEVASLPDGFTVLPGTAILTSLIPASGQQGQSLSINVTGRFTHFAQGTTQVDLGPGVSIQSTTVSSATALTAQITIDQAAALGARTLTVTTGAEVVFVSDVFTVKVPPSLIRIDLTPVGTVTLSKGQTFQFTAKGTFSDNSVQDPLAGVTWNSQPASVATITASGLATGVAAGVTSISASKSSIQSSSTSFVVKPLPIALYAPINGGATTVDGAVAEPGASVRVSVNGLPRGPTAIAAVTGAWSVTALSPALVVGDCVTAHQTVNGVTSDESLAVLVVAGTAGLVSITPATGAAGDQNAHVVIAGAFTHFAQGASQVSFAGTAVTVNSATVLGPTLLAANLSIAANALSAPRTVTVTTGTEVVALPNAFIVQPGSNHAPTITIAPTWAVTLPNRLGVTYTVADDGLPFGGALTTTWDTVSGPGTVGFQNQTLMSISVGFDQPGQYTLRVTATDTQFTVSQDVMVTVAAPVVTGPLVASIASPADGAEVTGPTAIIGTVSGPGLTSWTLEAQGATEPAYHAIASGTSPVTNATLGTLDPTLLMNGLTALRLRATDAGGQAVLFGPIYVVVTQNQKVGNFTASFNDLTIPMAGLPIQIIRTYDSRDKAVGDFGVGWRLDLKTVSVATTAPLGDNWTGTVSGGLFPNYCIQPIKPHVVTVTFGDGTVFQFQTTLTPACQQLAPLSQTSVSFAPISTTPPNAALSIVGNSEPIVESSWPGPVTLFDPDNVSTFDPDLYQLTMPDGRVLILSKPDGLKSMADPNGNTLTITSTGIVHSSGKSVSFERDGLNRIQQITDPAGQIIGYTYDEHGDLATVTDALTNVTTYTYNLTHGLLSIQDPRGIQPIKNVYDDDGRLIQHIDAFGFTITYTHDLNTRQEIVTDRLNHVTVNEYDDRGNVVRVTDPLGGVTTRTYDSRNNLLSETNPLGKERTFTYDEKDNRLTETNPLGGITQYTYNSRNQVQTITDPLDRITSNTYDGNGNLTSTTDPLGGLTEHTYDARGLRTSTTDALEFTTIYEYDAAGNLSTLTDALGHETVYTYDANGNRLTESRTQTTPSGPRTVLTSYEYDAQNRLTKTTLADGGVTRTVYNGIGKQSSTFDQLGHETKYEYDLMGRLKKTTFPDETTESATYDAEGQRTSSIDRAGRTTTYVYDELKRLTETHFVDEATTSTKYDAAGQVIAVMDPLGHTSKYAYDDAGRRTEVTDALGHKTSFTYDAVGNQLSMRDANNNVAQYDYDDNNRRTRVTYSDASFDETRYDALGRTTSKRDQAGLVTKYEYDALGHLRTVIDALGQHTSYTYDELGNRTSQTDANSHVTTFAYDGLGRRTQRTLPLGMFETLTYDLVGDLASKKDFNGQTTTYTYDALHRLTAKTPDATLSQPTIQFGYTATGQRATMVDASGTTNYTYDERDRLRIKETPQGTLTYTYSAVGSLTSIRSSNTGGTSVDYDYDAMNRLSTVTDNRIESGVTTYAFDDVGNLASFDTPNGITHAYTYNSLNRLTDLTVTSQTSSTTLASYSYTLGPIGNRKSVTEFGGRGVNYTYDDLYRLTGEEITGGVGGTTTFTYDLVGNRLSRSSPMFGLTIYTYDPNDRLTTDTYDDNGNTTASGGASYGYDFESHLVDQNGGSVSIVYNGDGNRVAQSVGGVTTQYLVDDRNLTGYAQVLEELSGGTIQRLYTYGLNRISQSQASGTSFYGYDGHGSVRLLTDAPGAVTDRYDYDAFGTLISSQGSTSNSYLYTGELLDLSLNLYYLRARYLSTSIGRFFTPDPAQADLENPISINRFIYGFDRPTDLGDPSGLWPSDTHDFILDVALLGFMPEQDVESLKAVSRRQDAIFHGGQNPSASYQHHMRDGLRNQSEAEAQAWYQQFLNSNLTSAQSSSSHQIVLELLGQNLHALADSTSPAHSCFAAWGNPSVPECANSNEDFRPWNSANLPSVVRHISEEADMNDPGVSIAENLIRNYYLQNFHHTFLSLLPARPVITVDSLQAFPELVSILETVTVLGR